MKPKPFRLEALLEQRSHEKDCAARDLAAAAQREGAAVRALAQLDERYERARAALFAGSMTAGRMRETFAAIEQLRALRPRLAEAARSAALEREHLLDLHVAASRAFKVIERLKERARAARFAYEELLEQSELDESNLTLAARAQWQARQR